MLPVQQCEYIFLLLCSLFVMQISSSDVLEKFEYKYSMKPPLLIENNIPFWTSGGNVSLSEEKIRLASSLRSQKGAVWSERISTFNWWKIDVAFRIFGRQNIGADGLAFWFTTSRGDYNGNVYGSSDKWHGLGVFFDSYDNDRKQKNPKVMAIINDGNIEFDHANDGGKDIIGECFPNYRNKPYVTRAVIQYFENTLQIYFHNGESTNPNAFELCFKKDNVYLPQNGYFGVSAATGELADDHDLYHVLVTSLHKGEKQAEQPIDTKTQEEYDAYQKVFEEKQKIYLKEHPEIAEVLDQQRMMYEVPMQMNVEQINEFLSKIYDIVTSVDQKIASILQTQKPEQGHAAASASGTQPVDQSLLSNINSLLYMNKETLSIVNDLRNKINSKTSDEKFQNDMINAINHLRQSSNQITDRSNSCSNTSCLTLPFFLIAIFSQCAVIVGVIYYKHQAEAKAKKLY